MKSIMTSAALLAVTLFAGPAIAQQQLTGTAQFCVKGASGPIKCEYQTMAACQQALPSGSSDQCISRSEAQGTVGGAPPASPATPKN